MAIGDKNINRIKGNIKLMIDKGAPDQDIDGYLAEEGVGLAELQSGGQPVSQEGINPLVAALSKNTPPPMTFPQKVGEMASNVPRSALNAGKGILGMLQPGMGLLSSRTSLSPVMKAMPKNWQDVQNLGTNLGEGISSFAKHPINTMTKFIIEDPVQYALMMGSVVPKSPPTGVIPKSAEKLYASAVKLPLSKKWTQTLPGKEVSSRTAAIRVGVEGQIRPSEYGIAKATQIEKETQNIINDILDQGSIQGDTVKTADLLKGLDNAYRMASNSGDPRAATAIIDKVAEKFTNRLPTLSTKEVQLIKQQLYKEVKDYTGEFKGIYDTAQKGIAHEAMMKLEDFYPQLHNLNVKDAAYIKLKEALERAVPRNQNRDILGIGTKILANRSIPMAIWEATIGHPQVKASLAFALNTASKVKPLQTIRKAGIPLGISGLNQSQPERK